uniref:Glycine cleavage system P protein n=1 Tax=Peronospora matthiolae TaxID=2874970 RepID=A0AAV1T3F7_9STRA
MLFQHVRSLRGVSHVARRMTTSTRRISSVYAPVDTFLHRHLGVSSDKDRQAMLATIGYDTIEALVAATVPEEIRLSSSLALPPPLSESQALAKLKAIAAKNQTLKSFIGMGFSDTLTPAPVVRHLLENPGWYTSYTPYQAEVSQGRLELLLNFQTMVSDLTGLDYANASLLDEATAAAEAMALAHGTFQGKRTKFFVDQDVHPQTIGMMQTRAENVDIELVVGNVERDLNLQDEVYSGVLLQYPTTFGAVKDYRDFVTDAHKSKLVVAVATDLLGLTQLTPPGEWGADIALGSAQRFGVPMMFGGPHAAFLATTKKYYRKMPGRIIGVSVDARGEPAVRMAMQTREQHIRRDKATSNICTAQALLANMAAAYAIYHGPEGLSAIAARANLYAATLAAGLEKFVPTCHVVHETFFDTLEIDVSQLNKSAADVALDATKHGVNVRVIDDKRVGVSMGESVDLEDLQKLLLAFGAAGSDVQTNLIETLGARAQEIQQKSIPETLRRTTSYLTHSNFHKYRSETELTRYLKRLEDKDLALNRSMISLGSCTMKLNAVSELAPVSWPEFMNVHPFVPEEQSAGYLELIESLNHSLAVITGFSAVSTQPQSGAQGEYAGLLTIRNYQRSIGQGHRNVCLIPVSAHGTNPASAVMAGMKVVVVKSDDSGNIDRADLAAKATEHSDNLSAFMITYPSTFGVFEPGIKDMTDLIHSHGAQVYMDGANMNAQVALCNPGGIGADVCHLNLHKTFCIPHGGGGPGVGSIGVAAHLAPFLPGHAVLPTGGEGEYTVKKTNSAVSGSPFGSAGILPIPWMYINMLGEEGLKQATYTAILNANYMAKKLESHYEVVFRSANGTCAHEFIIDIRPFKEFGIVEEDVAKRLQDFGFHSPTMSWPVSGTLMIEPTESEGKAEMDRFCEALAIIRREIEDVATGVIAVEDSPLKHAPHTVDVVTADVWDRKYSREQGAFPAPWHLGGKNKSFWPSVGRIDNVHGDRNLVCSCPPLSDYE